MTLWTWLSHWHVRTVASYGMFLFLLKAVVLLDGTCANKNYLKVNKFKMNITLKLKPFNCVTASSTAHFSLNCVFSCFTKRLKINWYRMCFITPVISIFIYPQKINCKLKQKCRWETYKIIVVFHIYLWKTTSLCPAIHGNIYFLGGNGKVMLTLHFCEHKLNVTRMM